LKKFLSSVIIKRKQNRGGKKVDGGGTTKYVLDGLAVIKEYDGSNNLLASYTPGISIRKDSSSYWYHYDGLGSTTTTTNSSQSVENIYAYDAFGNLLSASGTLNQPYRYVGHQFYYSEGDIGLLLLGHRWYDADVGRFVSRDPIGEKGGINLFWYTDNFRKPLSGMNPYASSTTPA